MARLRAALMLLACVGVARPVFAAEADLLYGDALTSALGGKVLHGVYGSGLEFTEAFKDGGGDDYEDERGPATGHWLVNGALFCTFYVEMHGGCFHVAKIGGNCFQFFAAPLSAAEERSVGKEEHYVAQGFVEGAPSTCPSAVQS